MPVVVVDASALGAIGFGETEGPAAGARLAGATLAAPAILWFEVTNIYLTKVRRNPEKAESLLHMFRRTREVLVAIHDVDYLAVAALARETGLSAYDASYLWLARQLGADLVTLDQPLAAATRA
jgi:predicted nucleic acid-binding protein